MLVPGTEDEGDALPFLVAQQVEEVSDRLQPETELLVILPARQDGSHGPAGRHAPGIRAGQRVPGMPGEGDDAPALHVGERGTAHQGKGDAVQVILAAQFQGAEVEADDGGETAGDIPDIGTLQGVPRDIFHLPGMAVYQVILVAVEDLSFGYRGCQALLQLQGSRLPPTPAGSEGEGEGGGEYRFQYVFHAVTVSVQYHTPYQACKKRTYPSGLS